MSSSQTDLSRLAPNVRDRYRAVIARKTARSGARGTQFIASPFQLISVLSAACLALRGSGLKSSAGQCFKPFQQLNRFALFNSHLDPPPASRGGNKKYPLIAGEMIERAQHERGPLFVVHDSAASTLALPRYKIAIELARTAPSDNTAEFRRALRCSCDAALAPFQYFQRLFSLMVEPGVSITLMPTRPTGAPSPASARRRRLSPLCTAAYCRTAEKFPRNCYLPLFCCFLMESRLGAKKHPF